MENQTIEQSLTNIINAVEPGSVSTEPGAEVQTEQPTTQDVNTPADGTQQTQPEQPSTQPETNGFKQLRNQYDSVKKEHEQDRQLLQKVADSMGISVDQLAAKIQSEEDKKKAQANNIPVEIQQQLREQQEQIRQLEMQNIRANYESRAARLRAEYNLNDNQMIEFAEKAKNAGFNVFTPGLDLNILYRSMNYDSIVSGLKEQIRQEVLKELQGNPTNNLSTLTPNPSSNNNNQMSEQDFMSKLFGSVR